jgi:two-component system, chemotaxis family, protein-glutamate methylesterase/glutaminase
MLPALDGRIDAIAIGASMGGVEALGRILPALAATAQVAVFVVLHLPRDRPSLLVEIYKPVCALRVCEAEDKAPVRPGTIYFAPPDYHLLVDRGRPFDPMQALREQAPSLLLSVDDPVLFARPSIDVLFESAADVYGERLLGIILTGANADGANGLKAIHDAGGITVVQDSEDALAALMPEAARQRHAVDAVLPLAGISRLLQQFGAAP